MRVSPLISHTHTPCQVLLSDIKSRRHASPVQCPPSSLIMKIMVRLQPFSIGLFSVLCKLFNDVLLCRAWSSLSLQQCAFSQAVLQPPSSTPSRRRASLQPEVSCSPEPAAAPPPSPPRPLSAARPSPSRGLHSRHMRPRAGVRTRDLRSLACYDCN